jgi:hypothetical protein
MLGLVIDGLKEAKKILGSKKFGIYNAGFFI